MTRTRLVSISLWLTSVSLILGTTASLAAPPYYDDWKTYTAADGLPSNKVFCVLGTDDAVWAGTDHGLARYRDGVWRAFTPKDGLAHDAVLCLAEDPVTGDLWIGTMGGLNRYSAGRFEEFTQLNSGLANDVIYGVTVHRGAVWAATAAGASRYEPALDRWTIFDETNTSMHEIWCYSVSSTEDAVYVGVWGGGLLEYRTAQDRWKRYVDPDGEMELDLFLDDGLIHDIISSVSCDAEDRIWIATYFGLSTYDGRSWKNFMEHDSPLLSNFINYAATRGSECWIATDNGLNVSDRETWWTYQRDPKTGKCAVTWTPGAGADEETFEVETSFPHNYILGIGFQGDEVWIATEEGVARGRSSSLDLGEAQPSESTTPAIGARR